MTRIIRNEFIPIILLGLILVVMIALGVEGLPAPLPMLRLLLGLGFVLMAPGYTLQAALFPRADDLDGPERLALSFGLSVAVIPPIALVLDQLPWGIRLWPIVISLSLFIVICSAVSVYRRRQLDDEERFVFSVQLDVRGWWADQDRTNRILYGILGLALVTAAIAATAIIVTPKPGDYFTEFYILGPEGLAESYPREAAPGQTLSVTMGIANKEGDDRTYRIELWAVDPRESDRRMLVAEDGPIMLGPGNQREWPVSWRMPWVGDDQQVEFLLYVGADDEPYRRLALWLNVKSMGPSG